MVNVQATGGNIAKWTASGLDQPGDRARENERCHEGHHCEEQRLSTRGDDCVLIPRKHVTLRPAGGNSSPHANPYQERGADLLRCRDRLVSVSRRRP